MIVVTGGLGFIGSALVKGLNDQGRRDIILVDYSHFNRDEDAREAKWKNVAKLSYRDFIHGDELFKPQHSSLFKEVETIFHMGACSDTQERDLGFLKRRNLEYSKEIWMAALQGNSKLIYASSAATYGKGEQGYGDDHAGISHLHPLNPYASSKQEFDEWALAQTQSPKVWYGLKFFNVYGPNEYHKGKMRSFVQKAFEQIRAAGKVKLFKSYHQDFKDGEQTRDFIYIKDAVRATLNLEERGQNSGIYNIGTGRGRTFYALVDSTFKAMELQTRVEFIDMPLSLKNQYQYFTQAEMKKYQKQFPEHNFLSLEEGVRDYVQNYLKKEDPYLGN